MTSSSVVFLILDLHQSVINLFFMQHRLHSRGFPYGHHHNQHLDRHDTGASTTTTKTMNYHPRTGMEGWMAQDDDASRDQGVFFSLSLYY